ncbi:MAG TPA: carboxypeptidase-like regulatory domain-containing protein [Micromonosporaceae bacterium]|nr:carboxypeptidase-like regulatory domain-containing protein [Micromonosporaceae bacterium]
MRRLALVLALTLAATIAAVPAPAGAADPTTGSVTGTLADGATPVADAVVDLVLPPYGASVRQARTDAAGRYRLDGVTPATYTLRFSLPGGLVQFHPGVVDLADATSFAVAAGAEVVVDEAVMAHGTLGGRVTTDSGAPAPGARVRLHRATGGPLVTVLTDADGDYRIPYPPNGTFALAVAAAERGATDQWAPRRRTRAEAGPVVITAGQHTTVDERLLPVGTISGRFTRDGEPVANVTVLAISQVSSAESVSSFTAADGTFRLRPFPGGYMVQFRVPAGTGLDQWAGGAENEASSPLLTVAADAEVVLEERQLPVGRVEGRLVGADGQPVAGAGVAIEDPSRDRFFQATTNADGAWFKLVWPGEYEVRFSTGSQVQWATGALAPEEADPVTVPAGGTAVVDDTLLPPGSLTVTAVDARSRAPLGSFCVVAQSSHVFQQECTSDGAAEFPALGGGSYTLFTTADDVHLDRQDRGVRVTSGGATAHVASMAPAGVVSVSMSDAAGGEDVWYGCVTAVPVGRPTEPEEFAHGCDDDGDAGVRLSKVPPGRYALFASPQDFEHGAQWVGPRGGVGSLAAARVLAVAGGATTDVSVRFDGAGAVAGRVTARSGGRPLANAEVGVGAVGAVPMAPKVTGTEADGRYVLDGLGPYRWTLYTSHPEHAGQWSGGVDDRLAATPVRVTAGATTTFDVALRAGATLTGVLRLPDGRVPTNGSVAVVNARTHDQVAFAATGPDGRYTVRYAGPVPAAFAVIAYFPTERAVGWHREAVGFGRAQVVPLPSGGTRTLDLRAPAPNF